MSAIVFCLPPPLRFGEGAGGRGSSHPPPLRFGEGAGGRGATHPRPNRFGEGAGGRGSSLPPPLSASGEGAGEGFFTHPVFSEPLPQPPRPNINQPRYLPPGHRVRRAKVLPHEAFLPPLSRLEKCVMHQASSQVSLRCPSCRARLKAARQLLGHHCPCPRCRHPVIVRVPIPSDSDIHLVEPETASLFARRR